MRYVERLEAAIEEAEDAEVRSIIDARLPGATFEPGSPALVEQIDLEYQRMISERTRSQT